MRFFDVENSLDYYSFGMLMPERNGGSAYRYSFNGMEKDDEVKGKGNSYTTTFRQYDARLGRWLSIDPVTHPQFSPYSAFDNNPIYYADPSGADSESVKPPKPRRKKVRKNKSFTGTRGLLKFLGFTRGKYNKKMTQSRKHLKKIQNPDVNPIRRKKVSIVSDGEEEIERPVTWNKLTDCDGDGVPDGITMDVNNQNGVLIIDNDDKGSSEVRIGIFNKTTNQLNKIIYNEVIPSGGRVKIRFDLSSDEQLIRMDGSPYLSESTVTFSQKTKTIKTKKNITYEYVKSKKKRRIKKFRLLWL